MCGRIKRRGPRIQAPGAHFAIRCKTGFPRRIQVSSMALLLRQKLSIISLLIYWPTIFILAHIPIPELVYKAGVSDASLHVLTYLGLVFLLWFAISPEGKVNWRRPAVWLTLLVVICYGVADELLQRYVGRTCDIRDLSANVAGAFTGLILPTFLTFWPALLAVTAIAVFILTNLASVNPTELLPVTSTIFYLSAYATVTVLWIRYIHLFLLLKAPQLKWLIAASIMPTGFLVIVKLFSVILGKSFTVRSVVLSAVGIAAVVIAVYMTALIHRGFGRIQSGSF